MNDLRDLIERVCTETLTAPEAERLNALLRESETARRTYLDYLSMHASLSWDYGPRPEILARRKGFIRTWAGSAAAALLMVGILILVLRSGLDPVTPHKPGLPWNDASRDSIEIWPVSSPPLIDGDLSDWSDAGTFRSQCRGEDGKLRWVEGRMRYDSKALYIAARIGDPFPLRNKVDPQEDPASSWMGGALQVRLSTDRLRPWPVEADHLEIRRRTGRAKRPEDTARSIVHLTMWQYAPRREACLHLAYGMDFDGSPANPPGYQGSIRQDSTGYVLEYAIPWKLLGVPGDPPNQGDVLSACWTVSWSDESGRAHLGQLVDILNPARTESRWIFMRAGDWGKAVYR